MLSGSLKGFGKTKEAKNNFNSFGGVERVNWYRDRKERKNETSEKKRPIRDGTQRNVKMAGKTINESKADKKKEKELCALFDICHELRDFAESQGYPIINENKFISLVTSYLKVERVISDRPLYRKKRHNFPKEISSDLSSLKKHHSGNPKSGGSGSSGSSGSKKLEEFDSEEEDMGYVEILECDSSDLEEIESLEDAESIESTEGVEDKTIKTKP